MFVNHNSHRPAYLSTYILFYVVFVVDNRDEHACCLRIDRGWGFTPALLLWDWFLGTHEPLPSHRNHSWYELQSPASSQVAAFQRVTINARKKTGVSIWSSWHNEDLPSERQFSSRTQKVVSILSSWHNEDFPSARQSSSFPSYRCELTHFIFAKHMLALNQKKMTYFMFAKHKLALNQKKWQIWFSQSKS